MILKWTHSIIEVGQPAHNSVKYYLITMILGHEYSYPYQIKLYFKRWYSNQVLEDASLIFSFCKV